MSRSITEILQAFQVELMAIYGDCAVSVKLPASLFNTLSFEIEDAIAIKRYVASPARYNTISLNGPRHPLRVEKISYSEELSRRHEDGGFYE